MYKQCKNCRKDVHCCIFRNNSGFTFVGIKNAKLIRSKIKKNYSYFLDYSPLPKKIIDRLKNDDPSLEGFVRYSQLDKDRLLRLKTKKGGSCIFLSNGKCEIYAIRPNVCRIFPFYAVKLIDGRIKVIEHDSNPKCPIVKNGVNISRRKTVLMKKIFSDIRKENAYYTKNIKYFSLNLKASPE